MCDNEYAEATHYAANFICPDNKIKIIGNVEGIDYLANLICSVLPNSQNCKLNRKRQ